VYAIGVVKRLTGLSERQLRYWEAQRLVVPARTPGNHRLYSQADMDALVWAARLRRRGYRLWDILALKQESAPGSQPRHESDADFRFRTPTMASASGTAARLKADLPITQDRAKLLAEIERRRNEMSDDRGGTHG
jgi:MerR family glutamine synthetase transcriptional repressor